MTTAKFPLGQILATPRAIEAAEHRFEDCLARHAAGDWGEIHPEDAEVNEEALSKGDRILSAYRIDPTTPRTQGGLGNTLWIVTEWDRSVTTLLLPDEY